MSSTHGGSWRFHAALIADLVSKIKDGDNKWDPVLLAVIIMQDETPTMMRLSGWDSESLPLMDMLDIPSSSRECGPGVEGEQLSGKKTEADP